MLPLFWDRHFHPSLSPCGDGDMTPANIAGMAAVKGLDVIALTDHNSCKNCPAILKHGEEYGITVIPGMELTTAEEVHVVCLFPALDDAMAFDGYVYERLLPIKNREDIFGKQQIMDADDQVTGNVERLLIGATDISFDQVFGLVEAYRGIAYPAHIDKSTTSLLSNLGFVPPDSSFTCAEISTFDHLHQIQKEHPYFLQCKMLSSSDAHYLEDIREPDYQIYARSRAAKDILEGLR